MGLRRGKPGIPGNSKNGGGQGEEVHGDVNEQAPSEGVPEAHGEAVSDREEGTLLMLLDYTHIVVPERKRDEMLRKDHISHAGRSKMETSIQAKSYWPKYKEDVSYKPLYQARESSLVPLRLLTVHFLQKT